MTASEKLIKIRDGFSDDDYEADVIDHLLVAHVDNEELSAGILKKDKSFKGCWDYIVSNARKQAKNQCAKVKDSVVYGWAEEYFVKSDEELKIKPIIETKPEPIKQKPTKVKSKSENMPKKASKPKKKDENIQLSLFEM